MSFIFTETEGMVGAGAATAGLAATTAGLAGPAAAAAMLGMASTIKELYGTSVMMSGATYTLTDLMAQASIAAVAAV
jgi:hypothetical protein